VFDYKIIHLATHADVGEDTRPWIAFRDDKLSLEELYATKNQAELVVLSACNTSQGELRTGEGLMSLARGFFSSGTQSVVATLWNANDRSTEAIMVDFYKQLKKGRTRDEALQYAKQQYLRSRSGSARSPYYWSSIILIGDAGQLDAPVTGIPNYYIIIGTGLVLLFAGFWVIRRYLRS
ncbi:MAG: CHAT domain-containing protein, partial [Sinomicrobium sp.]|nr:CHAT domain-containing protein [Sinomicrobium sp.]